MSMKDLLNKMSQLEALSAPKTRQVLNESSPAPVATTTSKRSLKDVFNELHEAIPAGAKPLPVMDPTNKKAGMGYVTSNNPTIQGMLSKLGPNDVQIVQAPGQAQPGQSNQQQPQQKSLQTVQASNQQTQTMQEDDLDEKWAGNTKLNPAKKGMFKGKTKADLENQLAALHKSGPHKKGSPEYTKQQELNFAIRAKGGWKKDVNEISDELKSRYTRGATADLDDVSGRLRSGQDGDHRFIKPGGKIEKEFKRVANNRTVGLQRAKPEVQESPLLGRGMSPEARARDVDQSDQEYILQKKFKDRWKKENPDKVWPGYRKAGFESPYDTKIREADIAPTSGNACNSPLSGSPRSMTTLENVDPAVKEREVKKIVKKLERMGAASVHDTDALGRVAEFIFDKLRQGLTFNQALVLSHKISEAKKAKPDFLDLDKDGNKKEPMKKPVKEGTKGVNPFAKKDDKAPAKSPIKGKKPDFLDLDKDGNKGEPMKKAADDKKKKVNNEGAGDRFVKDIKGRAGNAGRGAMLATFGAGIPATGIGLGMGGPVGAGIAAGGLAALGAIGGAAAFPTAGKNIIKDTLARLNDYNFDPDELADEFASTYDMPYEDALYYVNKGIAADRKKKKAVKENMNNRIQAARLEGKAHGLKGHAYNGKHYEDTEESRAYHEGYKEGLDECHGMAPIVGLKRETRMPATTRGMARKTLDLDTPLDEMEDHEGEFSPRGREWTPADAADAADDRDDREWWRKPDPFDPNMDDHEIDEMFSYNNSDNSKSQDVLGRRRPGEIAKSPEDYKAMKRGEPGYYPHLYPLGKPKGLLPEDDMEEGNAFTGALARTPKGDKFSVGGKSFTKMKEGDFAFEAWDRQLNSLINEGLSVSISKGQQNSPDSVNVNATDAEADKLLSLVKQAGMGIFGGDENSEYGSPEVGGRSEINAPGGIEVVGDHDGMLGLMKKLSGISGSSSDYEDEDSCDECGHCPCNCNDEEEMSEARCDECGMMESKCGCNEEMLDEVQTENQLTYGVAESGAQNPSDSGADNATNDEQGNAAANQALATADAKQNADDEQVNVSEEDEEDVNESFYNLLKKFDTLAESKDKSDEDEDEDEDEDSHKLLGAVGKAKKSFGKEQVDEWANNAGPGKTVSDTTFEQDIDFMTKVISGGLNKPKSTGQTTVPVVASQINRLTSHNTTDINESVSDWKKLAGIK